ncbi:MAG: hypothetical protein KGH80_08590 [Xanthomonadaceae bacterium]|nr:hypothetical protein [Xanthomonadaceae bacterium]
MISIVRHSGRECRNPETMDGKPPYVRGFAGHPCSLDAGNPCRHDGQP